MNVLLINGNEKLFEKVMNGTHICDLKWKEKQPETNKFYIKRLDQLICANSAVNFHQIISAWLYSNLSVIYSLASSVIAINAIILKITVMRFQVNLVIIILCHFTVPENVFFKNKNETTTDINRYLFKKNYEFYFSLRDSWYKFLR